ncbi:MAG: CHAT domain-containing protein [Pseudonocardiaceae bacterium]
MTTLDFELEISPGAGDAYPVLARAPGGEASTTMRLPMALAELDRQLAVVREAVLTSSAVLRRLPTRDEQPIQALGRRLFEAVVADDVRGLYLASAQRAREQGSTLRLVLRVRPPELARLPWEFLFDPGRQDYLGLAIPLVRYPDVLVPQQPLHVTAPLRILGMVARPGDQHALDVTNEQRRLRNALMDLERDGTVELSWVTGQTYGDLQNALDEGQWHVFHFVGHGGYDRVADEGTVALVDAAGRAHHVGADDLSRVLAEHHTLRLVLLNACDTGRGSALDAFSSTAGALMRRGIPAVVAMQFEITDSAAIRFAEAFYQNVAKRLPVDTGVMRARRELRLAKKDTLEWGTPVLYLRASDGRIFDTTTTLLPVPPGLFQNQVAAPDVEALYDEALAAFWTEQWDKAAVLLREVLSCRSDHPDTAVKLKQAVRHQQLSIPYAQARAAAETLDWEQAVVGFTAIADLDPTYLDVGERLEIVRRQQQIAGLQAEARRLHRVERWAAVVKVSERLHILDPAVADPDGLVTSARAKLRAAEQTEQLAAQYRSGLRLLDAGQWEQAIETLEQLNPSYRNTTALLARAHREFPDPQSSQPASTCIVDAPQTAQILHHLMGINAVAFSPDGRRLATASCDSTARIWNTTSEQKLAKFTHDNGVLGVAFSPDGRRLATASADRTARIWLLSDDE